MGLPRSCSWPGSSFWRVAFLTLDFLPFICSHLTYEISYAGTLVLFKKMSKIIHISLFCIVVINSTVCTVCDSLHAWLAYVLIHVLSIIWCVSFTPLCVHTHSISVEREKKYLDTFPQSLSHWGPSMQMCWQSTLCDLALPEAHFPEVEEKAGLHPI